MVVVGGLRMGGLRTVVALAAAKALFHALP